MSVSEQEVVVPSNPADREKIRQQLQEISNVKTMIEAKRGFISDELKAMSEAYNLPGRFVRKLANAYHKQTYHKEVADFENFESLYEAIVEEKK